MNKLKIGLLVDSITISQNAFEVVSHIKNNGRYEEPVIIHICSKSNEIVRHNSKIVKFVNKTLETSFLEAISFVFYLVLYRLIYKIEIGRVRQSFPSFGYTKTLEDLNLKRIICHKKKLNNNYIVRLDEDSINEIQEEKFDIILRMNNGILKGDILNISLLGVLSFHHGDNRINRGGPSGFWEVFNAESSSGFVLQKLTEELDGGNIILRGNVMTQSTWLMNNALLLEKSTFFLKYYLDNLAQGKELKFENTPCIYDKKLYRTPSFIKLICYMLKTYFPPLKREFSKKLMRKNAVVRWGVAFSLDKNCQKSLFRYHKIQNPKGRFLADPFVVSHNGRDICYVEDYDYKRGKGHISAVEIFENGKYNFLGTVLDEEYHLSYPYIFKHKDDIYMIPESSEAKEVRLYKSIDFPMKWTYVRSLIKNIEAVDSTLLIKKSKLFLLTNYCSASLNDNYSELHMYTSDDLIEGEFKKVNADFPLIFDSKRARNGGVINNGNKVYRVNQVHKKAHYGYGFAINEIKKLDESGYREEKVGEVFPLFYDGLMGTHHFNNNGKFSVVDYCYMDDMSKI